MIASLPLLPPVIDQSIQRVALDPAAAVGFLALAAAAAYLGYKKSPIGAMLLAFGVPFAAYRDVGNTTITIEKCIALGSALGLLIGGAPLWPRSRAGQRVLLAGGVIVLTIALSGFNATYSGPVAREFFKQLEYLLLFWCAATFIERSEGSPAYLVTGVVASTAIVSVLALLQGMIGGAPSGIWINGHPLQRAAGTLEGPNQLAGFLEAALPILWVWPAFASYSKPVQQYVTATSSAAMILALSRAGVVVAGASLVLLYYLRRPLARASVVPMLVGAGVGIVAIGAWAILWAHATMADLSHLAYFDIPGNPGGVGTREQLWPAALKLFLTHPLLGVGAGNYQLLLPTVGLHGVETHAGSLWLQTLAEQGVVGLLALLAFGIVALRETFVLRAQSPLALAAFLALTSLLAHQLVDDLFFFPKVASLCWLLLGAGTCTYRHGEEVLSGNGKLHLEARTRQPLERTPVNVTGSPKS